MADIVTMERDFSGGRTASRESGILRAQPHADGCATLSRDGSWPSTPQPSKQPATDGRGFSLTWPWNRAESGGLTTEAMVHRLPTEPMSTRAHLRKDGPIVDIEVHSSDLHFRGRRARLDVLLDVTDRVRALRAEEALRWREAELRAALRSAGMGQWTYRFATDTTEWSEELFEILGQDRATFTPGFEPFLQTLTPESQTRLRAEMKRILGGQVASEIDLEVVLPDGRLRWVISRVEADFDAAGRAVRLRGTNQDITERKRVEDALRRSEHDALDRASEIEQLYHYTPVGLYMVDRECRYVRINGRLAAINGLSVDQHIGRTVREVVSPEIADQVVETCNRVLQTGEPVLGIERQSTNLQSHETFHALCSYLPLKAPTGETLGIVVSVVDITDRKLAEQALVRSEERLARKNRIAQILLTVGDQQMFAEMLNVVRELAGSPDGCFAFVEDRRSACPAVVGGVDVAHERCP